MTTNDGYRFRSQVQDLLAGERLAGYLSRRFIHSTYEEWRTRIDAGEIEVQGCIVTADVELAPGQIVVWNRPPWQEETVPTEFVVLYEDDCLLAVDKPSGLPTLPGGGFYKNTLLELVKRQHPTAIPIHRLGRGTSGIVLFGLHKDTVSTVSKGWSQTRKIYRALCNGVAAHATYDIQTRIGPIAHPRLGQVFAANDRGKESRSFAKVLELGEDSTLFEVEIFTGRPHQIRIHMASIGHPLVGDPLYAIAGGIQSDNPGVPGDGGYFLRATRLVLKHPIRGKTLQIDAPNSPEWGP